MAPLVASFAIQAFAVDVVEPQTDVSGVLDAYIAREQPSYGWTALDEENMPGGVTMYRLKLTSQTWMGGDWVHPLNVFIPPAAAAEGEDARPGHCVLVITAGDESTHARICSLLAAQMGVPLAVLHQVPNQPLFRDEFGEGRGLREDALIAQTFLEFSRTGDTDWPLLLPMTRSVVSAMNALGEFSQSMIDDAEHDWKFGVLDQFLTTGASKRGWTTWLSAAADNRVFAIAPMVYDNLNLVKQIPLHYASWGEPSPSIHDYTERGLLEILQTERGTQLMHIVDPFAYRERLDVPKLLLIGTNDPYWPLAAIHEYVDQLPGNNAWCHYEPNAGHDLAARLGVLVSIGGFFDAVTGRAAPLPQLTVEVKDHVATIRVEGDHSLIDLRGVRLLACRATQGKDFRASEWVRAAAASQPVMNGASSPYSMWTLELGEAAQPTAGASAAYIAEVELADHNGNSFTVHAPVLIRDAENE